MILDLQCANVMRILNVILTILGDFRPSMWKHSEIPSVILTFLGDFRLSMCKHSENPYLILIIGRPLDGSGLDLTSVLYNDSHSVSDWRGEKTCMILACQRTHRRPCGPACPQSARFL